MSELTTDPAPGRRLRRRSTLLLALARRFAAETDPLRVLQVLLSAAQRALGGSGGSVSRWDDSHQTLVELLSSIPNVKARGGIHPLRGASGDAAARRQTVIINDYPRFERAVPELVEVGICAAMAVPMLHEARLLGVVVIFTDQPAKQFVAEEAELLEMFASMAAATLVGLERNRAEEQLRLLTERLERLTETTSDAIIVADRDMRLRAWNHGAEQLYGWSRHEVLGQYPPFIPAESRDETERLWRRVLEHAETVANYEDERLTKSGSRVPILATISPVRDESGSVVGLLGIAKDLSARRAVDEQRKQLGRMEERESIAMDLHDSTMQALYGVVLGLGAAERMLDTDVEETRATVQRMVGQLNGAIHELRGYIFDLREAKASRQTLSAGLNAIATEAQSCSVVRVELAVDERAEQIIGPDLIEQLLAVAREATSNVIRHAAANALSLRVGLDDRHVLLEVMDNGRGFDRDDSAASPGNGLANMSRRVRRVGGELSLESGRGRGTTVRVQLPIPSGSVGTDGPADSSARC